jgi:release factor glutamine methyltransferase
MMIPTADFKTKTISKLLQEGTTYLGSKDIPSPHLEAGLLLSASLSLRRIDLYTRPDEPVSSEQETLFLKQLERRAQHEPLQYITGRVEFYGIDLAVKPGVFIPRPETELIVEAAEVILPPPEEILDLCTGSGALAIALAKALPSAKIIATDFSKAALAVAQLNARRHDCASRITFLQGDLLEPFQSGKTFFDLIVCNPPYIPEENRFDLQPEVRDYEPPTALFAPEGGTAFYRRILREAPSFLAPLGSLLLEFGDGQATWFRNFIKKETDFSLTWIPDLAGIDRIAVCRRRGSEING